MLNQLGQRRPPQLPARAGNVGLAGLGQGGSLKDAFQAERASMDDSPMQRMLEQKQRTEKARDLQLLAMDAKREGIMQRKKEFDYELDAAATKQAQSTDSETLKQRSMASQIFLSSPEVAKSDDLTQQYVMNLVNQGIYTPEEGEGFMKLDPQQRLTMAKADLTISSKAMQKQARGEVTNKLTAPSKSGAQKSITQIDESLATLDELKRNFKKDYVGIWGKLKSLGLKIADEIANVPGGEGAALSKENKRWLTQRSNYISKAQGFALSYIKQLSGVAYSDQQLKFLLKVVPNDSDSPAEFEGKVNAMSESLAKLKGIKKQLLKEGVRIGSDEYKTKFLSEAKKVLGTEGVGYSEEDIQYTMEKHGMTREEVLDALKRR